MASTRLSKGKKRACVDDETPYASSSDEPSTSAEVAVKVSKPRRAVTKPCPVCDEEIPLRLLQRHAELEAMRVEEIVQFIGSSDVLAIAEPDDGLTARTRRSAVKARKSINSLQTSNAPHRFISSPFSESMTLDTVDKCLREVKRHRKRRNLKLREMTKEDEDWATAAEAGMRRKGAGRWWGQSIQGGTLCPLCLKMIPGDRDVVEAHVDACLAHSAMQQEQREREEQERLREESPWDEVDVDDDVRLRATDGANLGGLGFVVRDQTQQDIEGEIDVDGEDDAIYGTAQFTNRDILGLGGMQDEDEDVQIEDDGDEAVAGPSASSSAEVCHKKEEQSNLTPLVENDGLLTQEPTGMVIDVAELVAALTKRKDAQTLVQELQERLKSPDSPHTSSSSVVCRICLDPYSDPTVSTGCWHTCCRECWLRCLGSTKLCPICKRITGVSELRRVYL